MRARVVAGLVAAAVLALLIPMRPAAADHPPQPVPGAEAPAFVSARTAWLAGDEEAALPVLASLAQGGNQAARMLLALIDKSPEMQGPWLSARSRAERSALLRAPGGMSGTSWMRPAAAEGVGLAALWVELWSVDAAPDIALRFARAGEPRAAREALIVLAKRERGGFGRMAEDPDYPPALRFLAWVEWSATAEGAARAAAEAAAMHPGDPQRAQVGLEVEPAALEAWIAARPEAAPLAALCRAACPETVGACTRAGLAALGGLPALTVLGSPARALIDPEEYDASPAGQSALMRRIQLTTGPRGRASLLARTRAIDACLGERLAQEFKRY